MPSEHEEFRSMNPLEEVQHDAAGSQAVAPSGHHCHALHPFVAPQQVWRHVSASAA